MMNPNMGVCTNTNHSAVKQHISPQSSMSLINVVLLLDVKTGTISPVTPHGKGKRSRQTQNNNVFLI